MKLVLGQQKGWNWLFSHGPPCGPCIILFHVPPCGLFVQNRLKSSNFTILYFIRRRFYWCGFHSEYWLCLLGVCVNLAYVFLFYRYGIQQIRSLASSPSLQISIHIHGKNELLTRKHKFSPFCSKFVFNFLLCVFLGGIIFSWKFLFVYFFLHVF